MLDGVQVRNWVPEENLLQAVAPVRIQDEHLVFQGVVRLGNGRGLLCVPRPAAEGRAGEKMSEHERITGESERIHAPKSAYSKNTLSPPGKAPSATWFLPRDEEISRDEEKQRRRPRVEDAFACMNFMGWGLAD